MSVNDFARVTSPRDRSLRAAVRRLAIVATSRVLWQLSGVRNLDGTTEALNVEVFPGIGFYARPRSTAKAEAVMVNVGGANASAVVATRDEGTRKAVADLAEDEAAMFNSQAVVHVTGAHVDVRTPGGTAVALATLADLEALRAWLLEHTHGGVSSGAAFTAVAVPDPPSPAGTLVLRGE